MSLISTSIRDRIDLEIKKFKKETKTSPKFLVLDRLSYAKLMYEIYGDLEFDQDVTDYRGLVVHIEPKDSDEIGLI